MMDQKHPIRSGQTTFGAHSPTVAAGDERAMDVVNTIAQLPAVADLSDETGDGHRSREPYAKAAITNGGGQGFVDNLTSGAPADPTSSGQSRFDTQTFNAAAGGQEATTPLKPRTLVSPDRRSMMDQKHPIRSGHAGNDTQPRVAAAGDERAMLLVKPMAVLPAVADPTDETGDGHMRRETQTRTAVANGGGHCHSDTHESGAPAEPTSSGHPMFDTHASNAAAGGQEAKASLNPMIAVPPDRR